MLAGKTYWIIGASEGLGLALAQAMQAEGAHLILSARSTEKLKAAVANLPGSRAVAMDVTDAASVQTGVLAAGSVDGVVYCVGAYDPMAAPDWQPGRAEVMAEANYIGALRVLSHLVPDFAARRAGHIVLIGSLAGFRGLPGAIGYGSSKAALMHLAENLRVDLRGRGVRVQLANPGFIATRLTAKNQFRMPQLMTPELAASHVMRLMRSKRFAASFPAPFAWLFTLGQYLPLRWFQALF
jgi:short-subunit dehydrogenase